MISLLLALAATPALAQRILYQNDLSLNSNATSAILLPEAVTGTEAASACEAYNEQQLTSVTADLQDQLNYLVFRGELTNSSRIHVGGGSATPALRFARRQTASCQAYSVGNATTDAVDCATTGPVLCTNSAPPTEFGLTGSPSPAAGSEVTAGSSSASFQGFRDARSFRFLGVPFAQPPTGDLRFAGAQPYSATYSNYSAMALKSGCIQETSRLSSTNATGYAEDCLYLNIYTPVLPGSSNASLPVAFWIYGGAFTSGSNGLPEYDGGNMASRGDVVVVTTNYRLGALGNMASAALNGSQGITDQIEALRWVQQHITAFGGNADEVTIFGESAGAQSVLALMSSTPASGLFARAISESAPWNPFFNREVFTNGIYPALLNATSCAGNTDDASQLACLRALPADTFISNSTQDAVNAGSAAAQRAYSQAPLLIATVEPYLPVVGTGIVDGIPNNLIREGRLPAAGIPFMVGNVKNEGTLFVDSVPQLMNPVPALPALLDLLLSSSFDNDTAAAIQAYDTSLFAFNTTNPDALRTLAAELVTLDTWQCPTQQVLNISNQLNTFSSLYSFRFDRGMSQSQATLALPQSCSNRSVSGVDRVCHSEDVPVVFGTNNIRGDLTPFDADGGQQFSQYVQDVWTSFIRTGNPQPSADYLRARGEAYSTTLAYSQATPFNAYTGPDSQTAIHILNTPPGNSGPAYAPECQVLQNAGFLYQNVQA